MGIGELPKSLTVGGREYPIRSDYRNVLQAFEAFNDPELEASEKWIVAVYLLFADFSCADDVETAVKSGFDISGAVQQILWFISGGKGERKNGRRELPTYDWIQDEQMIFSAVNNVAKKEVREVEYMHWWTFLGYFNEIGDGTFSYIVGIRNKLNKGKKLEKHEKEFFNRNKDLIIIRKKLSRTEQAEEDAYQSMLDDIIG